MNKKTKEEKICKNCFWVNKKIGIRGNYCLASSDLHDVKLKDTCKHFLSEKIKCYGCKK